MEDLESRLSATLRNSATAMGDAGFSDSVMRTLPQRRRFARAGTRYGILAGAALAGGVATALLGPPLDGAFNWLARGDTSLAFTAAVLFAAGLAATTFWVFWSE